jgi:hypothetical protein
LIRFNPILGVLGIMGAFYVMLNYQESTRLGQFATFILISAFLQSVFIQSYPFKKWVTLMPVLLILTTEMLLAVKAQKSKWRFFWILPVLLFAGLIAKGIFTSNKAIYWSGFAENYNIQPVSDLVNVFYLGIVGLSVVFVFALICNRSIFIYVYASMILVAIFTSLSYIRNATFEFKNSLISFSNDIDNKTLIIGDFSHAFAFYNEGIVAHNPYSIAFGFIQPEQIQHIVLGFDRSVVIRKNLNQNLLPETISLYGRKYDRSTNKTLVLYKLKQ